MTTVKAFVKLTNTEVRLIMFYRINPEKNINQVMEEFSGFIHRASQRINRHINSIRPFDILKTLESFNIVFPSIPYIIDNLIIQSYIKAYYEQQCIEAIIIRCEDIEHIVYIDVLSAFSKKLC